MSNGSWGTGVRADLLAVPRNLMMRRIRAGAFHVLLVENIQECSRLTV